MNEANHERWLSAALAEYNTLRTESIQSMQYQQSTLSLGTAAIGVLLGFGVTGDSEAKLILLNVVVPLFAIVVYVLYGIEFMRMVRVGRYIDALEQYVNSHFEAPLPLGWEGWLDGRGTPNGAGKPRICLYWAVPLLILLIAFGSIALGLVLTPPNARLVVCKALLAIIAATVSVLAVLLISVLLKSSRGSFSKYFREDWRRSSRAEHDATQDGESAGAPSPPVS